MDLSLVLPAHNEEDRIGQTLERYVEYFPQITKKFELIIVVNNSTDSTLEKALSFHQKHPFIRVINIPKNVGKGGALIAGLNVAKYSLIGFMDADDAFELKDLDAMFSELEDGKIDIAIASKWKRQRFGDVNEPFARKVMSRGWNTLVRIMLHLKFNDTQAGAKFFSKAAWDAIPKNFIGHGFEFDVDLLSRFHNQGFRAREFYIRNTYREQSKFQLRHSFPMFLKLLRITFRKREQHPAYYYHAYRDWWQPTHLFYKYKINTLVSFIPIGVSLLDAGCGSGALVTVAAQKRKSKITGVDIRKDQVMFSKRLCPTGEFYQGDLRSLKLKKRFSVVNCSDVIEHFQPHDRVLVLDSLDRHVDEGGTLILAFPSWFYISVFERFWRIFRQAVSPRTHFDDDIHLVVSPNDIIHFYKRRGYRLIKRGLFVFGLLQHVVLQKDIPR
jgi:glycosyltransferase involved in cell wall biosynthesis